MRCTWERTTSRLVLVVAVLVEVLVAAACGGDGDRPTDAAWEPVWARWRDSVPAAEVFLDGGEALCDPLVGELRSSRQELLPTPTGALDAAVHAWITHAESVAFDCPTDDPALLRDRLHDLGVLTAEVDAGLTADHETS